MLNGKYVAIGTDEGYLKKGKIYEFVDGRTTFDKGKTSCVYRSLNDFVSQNPSFECLLIPYEPTLKEQYLLNQDVVRVVELRNGMMCFVLKDRLIHKNGWFDLKSFDDEMCLKNLKENYSVVKVYESYIDYQSAWNFDCFTKEYLNIVWERQEKTPKQIKKEEIEAQIRKLADELKELEV